MSTPTRPKPRQKLTNPGTTPPGGFVFKDPQTQFVSRAQRLDRLIHLASEHRKANGLPVPNDFGFDVEDQICRRIPPRMCRERSFSGVMKSIINRAKFTVQVVRNGSMAYFGLAKDSKASLVGESETPLVMRRAHTCAQCPWNIASEACLKCGGLDGDVQKAVGKRRYEQAKAMGLKVCAGCSCMLTAKVWFKHDVIRKLTPDSVMATLPDACWIKTEAKPE